MNHEQSESIAGLAGALAKAQGDIKGASKDSENPFFKSNYADLTAVWNACRAALTKNDLAVIQTFSSDNGSTFICTTLAHKSGEWMRGFLPVRPVKDDPQGLGSATTYMRRYALAAIVGVAPEDDDGEAASGRGNNKGKPAAKPKKAAPKEDEWQPPAKPEAIPVPADGDEATNLKVWATRFINAVDEAPTLDHVNGLVELNRAPFKNLPDVTTTFISNRVDVRRGYFAQEPAQAAE